jgi:hypothetical protein
MEDNKYLAKVVRRSRMISHGNVERYPATVIK